MTSTDTSERGLERLICTASDDQTSHGLTPNGYESDALRAQEGHAVGRGRPQFPEPY